MRRQVEDKVQALRGSTTSQERDFGKAVEITKDADGTVGTARSLGQRAGKQVLKDGKSIFDQAKVHPSADTVAGVDSHASGGPPRHASPFKAGMTNSRPDITKSRTQLVLPAPPTCTFLVIARRVAVGPLHQDR